MATVIDSLIVTLGLDSAQFKQGAKEVQDQLKKTENNVAATAKEMQAQGAKANEFFGSLIKGVTQLTAAFVGLEAIKAFTGGVSASSAAVSQLSNALGMSVQEITDWQNAFKAQAGATGDIADAFRAMQDSMYAVQTGNPGETAKKNSIAALFGGGNIEDFNKLYNPAVSYTEKMLTLAKLLHNAKVIGGERGAAMAQGLGGLYGLNASQINNLSLGADAIRKQLEEAQGRRTVTKEEIKATNDFVSAWQKYEQILDDIQGKINTILDPYMTKILKVSGDWLKNNEDTIKSWGAMGEAIVAVTAAVTALAGALSLMGLTSGARLLLTLGGVAGVAAIGGSVAYDATHDDSMGVGRWVQRNVGGTWLGRRFGITQPGAPASSAHQTGTTTPSGGVLGAIRQQESKNRQFDRAGNPIISGAGAIGIMQVTPSAGEDAAKRLGINFDLSKLMNDPAYNKLLGEEEYRHDLEQFGGDQTLALAAYNAGAGRVRSWLRRFGDPRSGQISDADWAAKIPFAETRNYIRSINKMSPPPDPSLRSGAGAAPGLNPPVTNNKSSSIDTDIHVGSVNINTQSTDAKGIAQDFHQSLQQFAYAGQANMNLV